MKMQFVAVHQKLDQIEASSSRRGGDDEESEETTDGLENLISRTPSVHHPDSPPRLPLQQPLPRVTNHIKVPTDIVWSLVRRFDQPQKYKPFVSRCTVLGDLEIGSVREVDVKSGLPATTSTEMLELLDDEEHILGIRIVGGDHRLKVLLICTQKNTVFNCLDDVSRICLLATYK
ncbi:PREDICTED: abscisic acid receptor PYL7-like [Ipomoea nil]|uniref:abscisic acid receptor PYL7-like n=1 Tax=Ipomoea nil TaxID=35883 RepID=UPI0009020125|nr:PREDICTED: abscisic acid receptor PYL7-like [Ipomoea nil]